MIKAAIIGCGKIADAHVAAISMVPDAEIVGVCDRELLMARQLSERFSIKGYYDDLREMLDSARPTVVHITTPPQSHFDIAKACLDSGCHTYIEKPFTVNADGARQLIQLAEHRHLKLTVGTDEQFSLTAIRTRRLIEEGYLGGRPVHMEAYYCYDLGDQHYARAFLANKTHWLRGLPGQLLQNIISHGLAKIVEYLDGDDLKVVAHGFTSGFLKGMGEHSLIDELRVILDDGQKRTAYFTFSTQMRPLLREFRIYGHKNGLIVNQDTHSLIKVSGSSYKSVLNAVVPLNNYAQEYRKNMFSNIGLFLKRDFHMKSGLKRLIEAFYQSIGQGKPVPIPYKQIIMTVSIMESIFAQLPQSTPDAS